MNNEDIKVIEALETVKRRCRGHCGRCCMETICGEEFKHSPISWQIPTLKPQLTDDEKVILRNLDKRFKWIARDEYKMLRIYMCEVERSGYCWTPKGIPIKDRTFGFTLVFPNLFQWCKWEDEPYLIADLLKD